MNRRLPWSLTAVLAGVVVQLGPLQAASKPFTFVAYGDSRDGHEVHRKLVARMRACKPKFTIGTGDFVDRGDNEPAWQIFADITAGLRKLAPYYPAKGNHDLERSGGTLYEKYLGMATNTEQLRYYSFNHGNSHFLVLDTNNLLSDEPQLQWLQEDLKATQGKFKHRFAVLHQPLFTLIPRRKEGSDRLCQKLQPIFTAAKLCGVFAGHDHYFYMTKRDGVTH
ncbi:MAG: metallophosphoesterase, partial [Armatimonadetes bacterium]|nr:metallophosphoesterase [Armatimonadota bacterium]